MTIIERLRSSTESAGGYPGVGHPFVRDMARGTLEPGAFRRYVVQNHHFLAVYCRFLALAAAKSPGRDGMALLTGLAQGILGPGLARHEHALVEHGGEVSDLERPPLAPTTAYTDFLLATAATGGFADMLAVLHAAEGGYAAVGRWLSERADVSDANAYAPWLAHYLGPPLQTLAEQVAALLDEAASDTSGRARDRLVSVHERALSLDRRFWDMAAGDPGRS